MNLRTQSVSALLAVLLVIALPGCGKSPEQHLQEGRAYMEKADYKAAILELKSTLQEQPGNQDARLLLGKAHLATDAYAEAEKELSKSRELGASDDQVLAGLAKALLRQGKAKDVLKIAMPEAGLSPQSIAALQVVRAEAFFSQSNRPDAEQAMQAASQADAGNAELLFLKARLALTDQKKAEAIQLIDATLQRDAKYTDALYLKAALLQQDEKTDEATKIYRQIIANDVKQFRPHLAIAELQLKKGNIEAADQSTQAAEKIAANHPMVRYARGMLELQRGKLDLASSALLDVLRIAPDHLPSALAYAIASYGQSHYEQSLKNAEKVLAAAPDNLIAAKIVAGSQAKMGNTQEALKILTPLLSKHPDDAKLMALAGETYLQAKDYTKAMNYLDKAAELDPENATIMTRQAAGHLATGNRAEAIADLEKATSLSDKAGQADLALVMLHLRNKEYDNALQAIKALEKKLPTNPVTHSLRATALIGKKDLLGARDALEQALAVQPNFFPAAVNLARLDMQEKKPEAARKRFEKILSQDKNNARAMLALADLAALEKKYKERVEWLERTVKAEPKALLAHQQLISYHLSNKDTAKALAQAKQAASSNPESLTALNLLGTTQLAVSDNVTALETFERIVNKAPQSPDARLLLAQSQVANKQFNAARGSLREALKIKPDFLKAQDALIKLELIDKQPEAALAVARQLQLQHPKSAVGLDREADIHLAQKRYPQAIKAYEQAQKLAPNTISVLKLHHVLSLAGDTKTAEQRLLAWLKQHPEDISAHSYAAEVYMLSKRPRDSIAQYEAMLKLQPNNTLALNNLANLYIGEKDGRALATAEQAFKLAPEHPSVQDTLGWIFVEQGQLPRGLELLSRAATKFPNNANIRYHYGVALMRSGKKAEAKKELAAAVQSGQKFSDLETAETLLNGL